MLHGETSYARRGRYEHAKASSKPDGAYDLKSVYLLTEGSKGQVTCTQRGLNCCKENIHFLPNRLPRICRAKQNGLGNPSRTVFHHSLTKVGDLTSPWLWEEHWKHQDGSPARISRRLRETGSVNTTRVMYTNKRFLVCTNRARPRRVQPKVLEVRKQGVDRRRRGSQARRVNALALSHN